MYSEGWGLGEGTSYIVRDGDWVGALHAKRGLRTGSVLKINSEGAWTGWG